MVCNSFLWFVMHRILQVVKSIGFNVMEAVMNGSTCYAWV